MHLGMAECHIQYHFRVTVILTFDLVFKIIVSDGYLIWGVNLKFGVWKHLGMADCRILLSVTVTLSSDLVFRIMVLKAFDLYILKKEFQIWCVNVSWDDRASRSIFKSLWRWPLTSFLEKSCREHISYIFSGRDPQFGVWMHLGMVICNVKFGTNSTR